MPAPKSYAIIVDPDRPLWERDTIACCHCSRAIFVKPGSASTVYLYQVRDPQTGLFHWLEEAGAWCSCCDAPVCLLCHDRGTCVPLERWLASREARGRVAGAARD
jgi:hypothetical protein